MKNTTSTTIPTTIDEFLRHEELRIKAARKNRIKVLRARARKIIQGAANVPYSLSSLDRLVEAMFARWRRIENGVPHFVGKYRDEGDELSVTRSSISFVELERVAGELAEATLEADLTTFEAYCAVNDALCDVAKKHPGW